MTNSVRSGMGKRRICFIIGVLSNVGGTERMCTVIANSLRNDYDVTILSTWDVGAPSFKIEPEVAVDYLMRKWEGKIYKLAPWYFDLKLKRYLSERRFDICVDVDICLAQHTIPAVRGLSTKVVEWEQFSYEHTKSDPELLRCLALAKAEADKIVVLTDQDLEAHISQAGIDDSLVTRIYNPSPLEGCRPSPLTQKNVLAIGRLAQQKGFDLLLRAWASVEEGLPGWNLLIVGSGEEGPSLERLRDELHLKRVRFRSATTEVEACYDDASLYVMSSRYEGLALVLLEALSKGLPIVSFDCPMGPREVVDDGESGRLVPNGDVAALSVAIIETLSSDGLRRKYSRGALAKSAVFAIAPIRDQWISLFESL